MTESATLSLRLTPRTKERLGRLAAKAKRSKSFLAAEAIEAYVARELEIVEGIQRGLADVEAGRVVPHAKAMSRVRKAIAKARRK